MGFAKLSDTLVYSSILREDDGVFKVFFLILSQTRQDGVSPISADFIAAVTRKPDDEVERCLAILEAPDPKSKSLAEDGRRIERVDGGFRVVNYRKYREDADTETVREYERERKRRQREAVPDVSGNVPGHSASASPSASVEEGGPGGGEFYRRGGRGPANPLITGRRPDLERDGYRLIREIGALEPDRDPTEILLEAARWESKDGRSRTKVRLETMSDDHLIRTVHDLRTILEAAQREHGTKAAAAVQREA